MKVRIEKIKKRDLPAFYSLFKKALYEDFKEFSPRVAAYQWKRHRKSNLLKWIKRKEEYIFLAKNNGRIAGILASQPMIGGVANCDWLIVSREFRGQGIGRRLLDFWENWVKRHQGHMLILTADAKNLDFYNKAGFRQFGCLKGGYFGNTDYYLRKRIGKWSERSLDAGAT